MRDRHISAKHTVTGPVPLAPLQTFLIDTWPPPARPTCTRRWLLLPCPEVDFAEFIQKTEKQIYFAAINYECETTQEWSGDRYTDDKKDTKKEKFDRRAEALRRNLRRRKEEARRKQHNDEDKYRS